MLTRSNLFSLIKNRFSIFACLLFLLSPAILFAKADDFELESPAFFVGKQTTSIHISCPEAINLKTIEVRIDGRIIEYQSEGNKLIISSEFEKNGLLQIVLSESQTVLFEQFIRVIPLWLSVLPPLVAILLALLLREVFAALLIGIFSGTLMIAWAKSFDGLNIPLQAFLSIIDELIIPTLSNTNHLSIIIFSMLIGAMVKLISTNGGMQGIVNRISKIAVSSRSGQLATWLMGVSIFFDDYANTLLVGNTMRPITDRLRISREKLAYLVDSTAAPIASIAFITTWIGAELSYIQEGIDGIGIEISAYSVFLQSLAYSFYPILTLFFVLLTILSRKEFGPMFWAEKKARLSTNEQALNDKKSEGKKNLLQTERSYNALIPVSLVIITTVLGLYYTGSQTAVWDSTIGFWLNISGIIAESNTYQALLWSSSVGVLSALILTISQRIFTLSESIEILIEGLKTMMHAVIILILAWSLAKLTEQLYTASYITGILLQLNLSIFWIPALSFVVAALIAFATGSSWGTMAILYPLMIPATWALGIANGLEDGISYELLLNVISVILAGSVLGDHCSPISDTTIMSSLACSCNHIDHVRTQLPYALIVGFASVFLGTVPAAFGISTWILFPVAMIFLVGVIYFLGKPVSEFKLR